jgi:primosomal replication protein N
VAGPASAAANRVVLGAVLESSQGLRYTPAGVPVLSATARHESGQVEAGHPRRVEFPVELVVVGDEARRFAAIGPGTELELTGFLAARHRNSSMLVLHVTEFRKIQTD